VNATFGYGLALLLAAGGPAATQVLQRDSQLLAAAAAAAPGAATPKPVAGTSETPASQPPVAPAPGSPIVPTGTSSATPVPAESAQPATGSAGMPATPVPSPDRPAWVDEPSGLRAGGDYVMQLMVTGFSRTECEQKLTEMIERRLVEYVAAEMPYDAPVAVPFDVARLRPRIVNQMWEERIRAKEVELVYLHAQLRIDDKLRREWKDQAIEAVRSERSRFVMFGYAGVIAAAVAVYVLLKWSGRRSGVAGPFLPAVTLVAIIVGFVVMAKFFFAA
jgi:hypothetical protein